MPELPTKKNEQPNRQPRTLNRSSVQIYSTLWILLLGMAFTVRASYWLLRLLLFWVGWAEAAPPLPWDCMVYPFGIIFTDRIYPSTVVTQRQEHGGLATAAGESDPAPLSAKID